MKVYYEDVLTYIKSPKTIGDIFDNLNEVQKNIAYEMIGQALEYGVYDREALVMFNKEETVVMNLLLTSAMTINI